MADLRKWFPVLAVVALLAGSAVTADAQAFQCTANAGVPPLLRAEGLTELVGDLILNCDGAVPPTGITANIRIFLNTNVTSKLVTPSPNGSEALLLIDEPEPADQVYQSAAPPWTPGDPLPNVFQGLRTGVNTVDWLGVPIVAPGSSGEGRVYRITNVRSNANQLGVSASLIPTQVFMFISISGTTSVPVNNPQQVVGFVVPGMTFSVTSRGFQQCAVPAEPVDTIPLTFMEGFASSFKTRGEPGQDEPGTVYDTETGFTPAAPGAPAAIGTASQGTRLMARLAGIPSGVSLSVPLTVPSSTVGGQTLRLISGHDANGAGGSPAASGSVSVSGGAARIVYEVVAAVDPFTQIPASSATVETYAVPVSVVYTAAQPGLTVTPVTVNGNFAPISTVTTASATAPIPRFADVSEARSAFTISPCRTLLLFPFVTNAGNWDTGMAIDNTSLDPFATPTQSGACVLHYFGNIPATGAPAPAPVTTPVIEGGEQLAFVASSGGGVVGTTKTCAACATPGFQGYMIAVCDFQFAHGYAFVSDLGATRLAQGYLALVIPDRATRLPQAFSLGAGSNHGEQLVH